MRLGHYGVLALVALSGATSLPAAANESADIRKAYEGAVRCFVANGHLVATFRERGDAANSKLFTDRAQRAHQAAGGYGSFLRLTKSQMEQDFSTASDRELPKLMTDPRYLTSVAAACKRDGLM